MAESGIQEIQATARPRAGKGAARAVRRAGKVPAVIYGDKKQPQTISLDYYDNKCKCYDCSRLMPQQDVLEAAMRTFEDNWRVVDFNR